MLYRHVYPTGKTEMTDHMNGNTAAPAQDEELPSLEGAVEQPISANKAESILDGQIMPAMGFMIRGMMVSAPGVPPAIILQSIARCVGQLLAMSVAGNTIEMTAKARKDFQECFHKGIVKVPILQPAAGAR